MVTMIVTKVVECSRLSVRMGKKNKNGLGKEGRPSPMSLPSPRL